MSEKRKKSLFDLDILAPYREAWETRQQVLRTRMAYYDGSMYASIRDRMDQIVPFAAPRVYRGVKALYLPLARAVKVDMGIIPGGWSLPDGAPGFWHEGMDKVFQWSRWARYGLRYVFYGAVMGISGIKVLDLREEDPPRVVLMPMDPRAFMLLRETPYGEPWGVVVVEERTRGSESYEYGELITTEEVVLFKNGEMMDSYANPQGQIPVVEIVHEDNGDPLGEATFSTVIPLLNEVNSLSSYLADIIKKHSEPQWAVFGAEATDLFKEGDSVWFFPAGADVKPIVPDIDIEGVLEFVKEIAEQVKGGLPELAFDELKGKERVATATVELQLMELVLKIRACRPNYDYGLVEALRKVARAAASMGLDDEAVVSLDDDGLALDEERPVIPLGPEAQMDLRLKELAVAAQEAVMIQEGVGA